MSLTVVLLLSFVIFDYFVREREQVNVMKDVELSIIANGLEVQNDKNNELKASDEKYNTDEDYIQIARDHLGLIKKDEIVIKPR